MKPAKPAILGAIALTLTTTAPTLAIPFGNKPVYRVGTTEVYFSGMPNTEITVQIPGNPTTKAYVPTIQGYVVIKPPTGKSLPPVISVNNSPLTLANLPLGTLPAPNTTPGESVRTAAGEVVLAQQSGTVTVSYILPKDRKLTLNACGFAKLGTDTNPAPAIMVFNTQNIVTAELSDAVNPPICKKNAAGGGVGYRPTNWDNGSF